MKTHFFLAACLFVLSASSSNAQINNPLNVIKHKATDKVNNEIDKDADKIVNPESNEGQSSSGGNQSADNSGGSSNKSGNNSTPNTSDGRNIVAYANYDFVAGDKIIFEDDFRGDMDGEFPSHWNLISGQAIINQVGGHPAFLLTDGNYARVKPLIRSKDYLGNSFTIEYDTYLTEGAYGLICMFHDSADDELGHIYTNAESVDYSAVNSNGLSGSLAAAIQYHNYYNKWHHIAIAYKNRQMKVYVDQYRPLVVPNVNFVPATMQFAGIGDLNNPIIVKNVRIAQGGDMNMLNSVMTTGRIVTHNITFDINQAVIKPESMGEINRIYKILNENKDMKFEIQGHTDSDGDDASNLALSQARADAVKAQFVSMGIADSRLTTKGFGESKPLSPNDTQEGKANNRRVEFVKQ